MSLDFIKNVLSVFFLQEEDGIRDDLVTGVQRCALPISRHTELKRFAKKSQLISAASRTSGWRRLMICSRDERNKSSWRSSRGWLIVPPNSESRRHKESQTAQIENPKRKKTAMNILLSCKIKYLFSSNHSDQSMTSEYITGG